jgi:acyl carrier protein
MTATTEISRITTELADYFASVLRTPRQQIVTDVHILELGVDSIMLVEAQRWLKVRFGCRVEVQQFFEELHTIDRLAAFLAVAQVEPGAEPHDRMMLQQASGQAASIPVPARTDMQHNRYALLRSQLSLLREVIEAQNRLLKTFQHSGTQADDATL